MSLADLVQSIIGGGPTTDRAGGCPPMVDGTPTVRNNSTGQCEPPGGGGGPCVPPNVIDPNTGICGPPPTGGGPICPPGQTLDAIGHCGHGVNACIPNDDPCLLPPGSPCPPGFSGTIPNCVPTGPGPCPTGQHRDASGNCVTDTHECPAGQIWDSITNQCRPITSQCPTGQHWEQNADGTWRCVPDSGGTGPCPTGQHRDASGNCVSDSGGTCPSGQHRDASGNCVPDSPNEHNCPPGTHWIDAPGAPGGGGCVPDGTTGPPQPPPGGCPTGTTWDGTQCLPDRPPIIPPGPPPGPPPVVPPRGTPPGQGGGGVPFGQTQFPLWVYTGPTNEEVHQIPQGPPGSPGANVKGQTDWKFEGSAPGDIHPDPGTHLCPDGSQPDASGNCPQIGGKGPTDCSGLVCGDKSTPTWDYTASRCMCADGGAPTNPTVGGGGNGPPIKPPPAASVTGITESASVGGGGGLSDMVQNILSGS